MANVKRCIQCGMLKAEEDYREYTYSKANGTSGRYRVCKECEALNSRYKRLLKQNTLYDEAIVTELHNIEDCYRILMQKGLRTPLNNTSKVSTKTPESDTVEKLKSFYQSVPVTAPRTAIAPEMLAAHGLPDDLMHWLMCPVSDWEENNLSPEYLQETIYESLKAKYRPQLGFDAEKGIPVYDNTYKDTLNEILRRFDDYEETYAESGEPNV